MERVRSMRTGPERSTSIASLANVALAHREELREKGRWKAFKQGKDVRHIKPNGHKSKALAQVMDQGSDQELDHPLQDQDSSEEVETN